MVLLVFILKVAIDDRELRANAGPVAPVAPDRITGGSAYVGGDGGALGLPWYYGAVVEGRERRAGVRRVRSARSLGATDHQDSNVGRGGGRGGGGGGGGGPPTLRPWMKMRPPRRAVRARICLITSLGWSSDSTISITAYSMRGSDSIISLRARSVGPGGAVGPGVWAGRTVLGRLVGPRTRSGKA